MRGESGRALSYHVDTSSAAHDIEKKGQHEALKCPHKIVY